MTSTARREYDPQEMTPRARLYLTIAAVRHLLVALPCLLAPQLFVSASFRQIADVLPMQAWGVVFLGVSLACATAAVSRSEVMARVGLILSAASTAVWAGGLTAALFTTTITGPTGPVIWWAVTFKDLVVCRQPMRSPFEPLVRMALGPRSRGQ